MLIKSQHDYIGIEPLDGDEHVLRVTEVSLVNRGERGDHVATRCSAQRIGAGLCVTLVRRATMA